MICDPNYDHFERGDLIKLFTILSTHISPIFQTEKYDFKVKQDIIKTFDKLVIDMINAETELARKQSSSVTFVQYNLKAVHWLEDKIKLNVYGNKFKNRISEEFKSKYDVLQLHYDSVLVIMPGANPLDIEFNSATIKQDIEATMLNEKGESYFSVHYASQTHIKSNENALDILNALNINIANQSVDIQEFNG